MNRFCAIVGCIGWTFLCLGSAVGWFQADAVDYCIASGVLSLTYLSMALPGGQNA